MKHGDISNHVNVSIGIMCSNTLIHYKENTVADRLLNKIIGRTKRAEIDNNVRSVMEYIYRNTEYTVDLLVEESEYIKLKSILEDMPYNRVVKYTKLSQLTARLLSGDLSYIVDNDTDRRGKLNSMYAIPLNDLSSMLKRGRGI